MRRQLDAARAQLLCFAQVHHALAPSRGIFVSFFTVVLNIIKND